MKTNEPEPRNHQIQNVACRFIITLKLNQKFVDKKLDLIQFPKKNKLNASRNAYRYLNTQKTNTKGFKTQKI